MWVVTGAFPGLEDSCKAFPNLGDAVGFALHRAIEHTPFDPVKRAAMASMVEKICLTFDARQIDVVDVKVPF